MPLVERSDRYADDESFKRVASRTVSKIVFICPSAASKTKLHADHAWPRSSRKEMPAGSQKLLSGMC